MAFEATNDADDYIALISSFDKDIRAIVITGYDFEFWAKDESKKFSSKYSYLPVKWFLESDHSLQTIWCTTLCSHTFDRRKQELETYPVKDILERDEGFSLELFKADVLREHNMEAVLEGFNSIYSKNEVSK